MSTGRGRGYEKKPLLDTLPGSSSSVSQKVSPSPSTIGSEIGTSIRWNPNAPEFIPNSTSIPATNSKKNTLAGRIRSKGRGKGRALNHFYAINYGKDSTIGSPSSSEYSESPGSTFWEERVSSGQFDQPADPAQERISRTYANEAIRIPLMADELIPGQKLSCFLTFAIDPGLFFVRPYSRTEEYKEFAIKLNDACAELRKEWNSLGPSSSFPRRSILFVGLDVAVGYEGKWHRARITALPDFSKGENLYKVHLIDFGPIISVESDNMQLLLAEFATPPAFAIGCYLYMENNNKEEMDDWNEEQREFFFEIVRPEPLQLVFKETMPDIEGKVWLVEMNIIEKYTGDEEGVKVCKCSHKWLCRRLMNRKSKK